jgi:hypothetical protein
LREGEKAQITITAVEALDDVTTPASWGGPRMPYGFFFNTVATPGGERIQPASHVSNAAKIQIMGIRQRNPSTHQPRKRGSDCYRRAPIVATLAQSFIPRKIRR